MTGNERRHTATLWHLVLLQAKGAIVTLAFAIMFLALLSCVSRQEAYKKSCQNNLRQLGQSLTEYSLDFDSEYPWQVGSSNPSLAWKDLGFLYPAYASSFQVFLCPSSSDRDFEPLCPKGEKKDFPLEPFVSRSSREVISYGYGFNGGSDDAGPWRSTAPNMTRLLADKKAGVELARRDAKRAAHSAKGRNVLHADGHFGAVKWVPGMHALHPNPTDESIGAAASPHYRDWWSDPPFYGE